MIWSYLIHLGYNMWADRDLTESSLTHIAARPHLRCDKPTWDELLTDIAKAGFNQVVIDLGEGIRWQSHPEIAAKGAWSLSRLRRELGHMRRLGLEPIPKLNFSTCHDMWLGPYARCVSTGVYYAVCRDLIAEAIELFDSPRFFHLGMDEEDYANQRYFRYVTIRQYDLWWHDLYFLLREVEKRGVRPWVWSDALWNKGQEFLDKMPQTVLQSNWYYGMKFTKRSRESKAYIDLFEHGYDQVPAASNWTDPDNFRATVEFCHKHIAPERLLGFMQTVWRPTLPDVRKRHDEAIRVAAKVMAQYGATPAARGKAAKP